MNWWLLLIPVLSALLGWFINHSIIKLLFHPEKPIRILGITFQGIIPKRKHAIAVLMGKYLNESLSSADLERRITDPENLRQLTPFIEEHVEHFLKVKLIQEMPYLSILVGDKTISVLKKTFMKELEILFPQVMKAYAVNLKSGLDVDKLVSDKISALPARQIEKDFYQSLSKEITMFKLIGTLVGFIIGIFQIIITLLTE